MTDRQKLAKLLIDAQWAAKDECIATECFIGEVGMDADCEQCKADIMADYLFDHGVTVKKRGRWELLDCGRGTCSECNFTQKDVWGYDSYQRYCGLCGAKMDLEG